VILYVLAFVLHSYSFAIVGINLTSVACQLLRSGALRSHLYNAIQAAPQLTDFHDVYGNRHVTFDLIKIHFWCLRC